MHLQSDLTRGDCKSLPRANFTLPSSLLSSPPPPLLSTSRVGAHVQALHEPALLSMPSTMAVCSAEGVVYKGITTTYG